MRCPHCEGELTEVAVALKSGQSVLLDYCQAGCRGIWFDEGELDKLDEPIEGQGGVLDEILAAPRVEDRERPRAGCPRCHTALREHQFSYRVHVYVDGCPSCEGFWLDGGELKAVRDAYWGSPDAAVAGEQSARKEQVLAAAQRAHQAAVESHKSGLADQIWKVISFGLLKPR